MTLGIPEPCRGKIDILADILIHSTQEASKTYLMAVTRLDYEQTCRYLKELEEKSCIEKKSNGEIIFRITQNGRHFLDSYRKMMRALDV